MSHLNEHVLEDRFNVAEVPLTGYSLSGFSRRIYNEGGVAWSDFVVMPVDAKYRVVTCDPVDAAMLMKQAGRLGVADAGETARYDTIIHDKLPDFALPGSRIKKDGPQQDGVERISMRELRSFLDDPASASLMRHLDLFDDSQDDDPLSLDCEPFYSDFFLRYGLIRDVLGHYIKTGSEHEAQSMLTREYDYHSLKGDSPDGAFSALEHRQLIREFLERLRGKGKHEGLAAFYGARKSMKRVGGIVLGDAAYGQGELVLPPLGMGVTRGGERVEAGLSGFLEYLWINHDEGCCETVIITMAKNIKEKQLLAPFLFYIAAASGLHEGLFEIMGRYDFIIHVSLKESIKSYRYSISREQAQAYLKGIVTDYLDENLMEHVPLPVVFSGILPEPFLLNGHPGADERERYYELFSELAAEKDSSAYSRSMVNRLLMVARPHVPVDVYDRVFQRFHLFSMPFASEKKRGKHE